MVQFNVFYVVKVWKQLTMFFPLANSGDTSSRILMNFFILISIRVLIELKIVSPHGSRKVIIINRFLYLYVGHYGI